MAQSEQGWPRCRCLPHCELWGGSQQCAEPLTSRARAPDGPRLPRLTSSPPSPTAGGTRAAGEPSPHPAPPRPAAPHGALPQHLAKRVEEAVQHGHEHQLEEETTQVRETRPCPKRPLTQARC